MILFIAVGTDIYPAISIAYEESEAFVMTVPPRSKDDHLVNSRLMINSYGSLGLL